MELIAEYSLIDEPRRVESLPYGREWADFHESRERTISVFAGRRTGKSYNLALRATRSEYHCMIFVRTDAAVRMMVDLIRELNPSDAWVYIHERGSARIVCGIQRIIRIESLSKSANLNIRGQRYRDMEVMFDEYDHESFEEFMTSDYIHSCLEGVRHIVCVGSIGRTDDSSAKRWFKGSDTKIFVDAESQPPTRGHMRYDFFPSEKRLVLENLPPFNYEI